jgi:3'-phosphoadenosine 5'-phosphosulfate sulfotransferase (PAPS reductase)/FAD synthetase
MITTALEFSGGKDSLACLYLYRDAGKLEETVVLWVNTGDAYPETIAQMQRVREWVPHFHEVKSDQPSVIAEFGFPSDVVPGLNTRLGQACTGESGVRIQSFMDCCARSVWLPMHEAVKALGVTRVVRGQRNDERRRAPIKSGHVEDGIEYLFPIEDWTEQQVYEYLQSVDADLPAYYREERTSRDCMHCTAYLDESAERIRNLPTIQRGIVLHRIRSIAAAVRAESRFDQVLA